MLIERIKYAGDIFEALVKRCEWDIDTASAFLESIPDAPNASLRPKGEWIYHECVSSYDGAISGYSCSQCCAFVNEDIFDMDEFHKDFCGGCGADMRGDNK